MTISVIPLIPPSSEACFQARQHILSITAHYVGYGNCADNPPVCIDYGGPVLRCRRRVSRTTFRCSATWTGANVESVTEAAAVRAPSDLRCCADPPEWQRPRNDLLRRTTAARTPLSCSCPKPTAISVVSTITHRGGDIASAARTVSRIGGR